MAGIRERKNLERSFAQRPNDQSPELKLSDGSRVAVIGGGPLGYGAGSGRRSDPNDRQKGLPESNSRRPFISFSHCSANVPAKSLG